MLLRSRGDRAVHARWSLRDARDDVERAASPTGPGAWPVPPRPGTTRHFPNGRVARVNCDGVAHAPSPCVDVSSGGATAGSSRTAASPTAGAAPGASRSEAGATDVQPVG